MTLNVKKVLRCVPEDWRGWCRAQNDCRCHLKDAWSETFHVSTIVCEEWSKRMQLNVKKVILDVREVHQVVDMLQERSWELGGDKTMICQGNLFHFLPAYVLCVSKVSSFRAWLLDVLEGGMDCRMLWLGWSASSKGVDTSLLGLTARNHSLSSLDGRVQVSVRLFLEDLLENRWVSRGCWH